MSRFHAICLTGAPPETNQQRFGKPRGLKLHLELREGSSGSSSMRPWSFDVPGTSKKPKKSLKKSLEISKNPMSASGIEDDRGMSGDDQLGNMKSFFHQLETKPFKRWRLFGGPWVTDYEEFGADFAAARTQSRSQGQKQKAWRFVWKWDRPNLKDILDCFMNLGILLHVTNLN